MDKEFLELGIQEGRIFKIGKGFFFAVQIPDDTVGGSGSRCSYCNASIVCCHQICRHCDLPLIGPFGFPQLPEWELFTLEEKRMTVEEIYCHHGNRGRLLYTNVEHIPLTFDELTKVEEINYHDADLFLLAHEIAPQKIREILLT
ncbi:hypothetical protein KAU09_00510 [Candidatus Parcubacteria bacterium]|nr:hypothetical protein [Candidatus Parcubacteria bacterium]